MADVIEAQNRWGGEMAESTASAKNTTARYLDDRIVGSAQGPTAAQAHRDQLHFPKDELPPGVLIGHDALRSNSW